MGAWVVVVRAWVVVVRAWVVEGAVVQRDLVVRARGAVARVGVARVVGWAAGSAAGGWAVAARAALRVVAWTARWVAAREVNEERKAVR